MTCLWYSAVQCWMHYCVLKLCVSSVYTMDADTVVVCPSPVLRLRRPSSAIMVVLNCRDHWRPLETHNTELFVGYSMILYTAPTCRAVYREGPGKRRCHEAPPG